jgi:hypothetical protein
MRILAFLGGLLLVLMGSWLLQAQEPPAHGHRDRHGNPQDLTPTSRASWTRSATCGRSPTS